MNLSILYLGLILKYIYTLQQNFNYAIPMIRISWIYHDWCYLSMFIGEFCEYKTLSSSEFRYI